MKEYIVTDPTKINSLIRTAIEYGGGTIFFPNGVYGINDITVPPGSNGLYFLGESRDGTILQWNGQGTGVLFRLGAAATPTRSLGLYRMTLDGRIQGSNTTRIAETGIIAQSVYESSFEDVLFRYFELDAFQAPSLFIANTIRRIKTDQIHRNGLFLGENCNANCVTSCRLEVVRARENAVTRGAGIRLQGRDSFANTIASCVIESNDIGIDVIGPEGSNVGPQKCINVCHNHFENNQDADIQAIGLAQPIHGLSIRNNWVTYGAAAGQRAVWLRLGGVRSTEVVANVNTKWGVEFVDRVSTLDCYFAANQSVQFRNDFRPQYMERQPVIPLTT